MLNILLTRMIVGKGNSAILGTLGLRFFLVYGKLQNPKIHVTPFLPSRLTFEVQVSTSWTLSRGK